MLQDIKNFMNTYKETYLYIVLGMMFFRHKIQWMQVIMVFICVISMIFIFTCPGNALRKIAETER